jgi:hypothetical protein
MICSPKPIDEPPASASHRTGCGAPVVDLDIGHRLGSQRHRLHGFGVRKTPCLDQRGVVAAPGRAVACIEGERDYAVTGW